ncbi:MAG TPA: biosynthetic peptidoglycan transglycosylase [bacterium]|nr:biosynthetic peptidoglycan transglycosylase [bacterium]
MLAGIAVIAIPSHLPVVPYSTILLDRSENEIAEIVRDERYRHRPTDLRSVPDFLETALIAIEDRHYRSHLGISLRGIGRAIVRAAETGSFPEGASTIPAQQVRNTLWPTAPRSIERKIAEFAIAFKRSLLFSKEEILEGYLDSLSFGRLAYGPESGARVWFGRPLSALSRAELLALVTIAKNPGRYDPIRSYDRFAARYAVLAGRLSTLGVLSSDEAQSLVSTPLLFLSTPPQDRLPYVRDFIASLHYPHHKDVSMRLSIDAGLTDQIHAIADWVRTGIV